METPRKPLKSILSDANTPFKVPASPLMKTLGFGTGVNVYFLERGQARSPWAIKRVSKVTRMTNRANSKLFSERIVKEASILRQLKHPNIVGFRAISKENDEVDLALECCKSSLGSILEDRLDAGASALPAHYIKKMLLDVSSALNYLHEEAKLLHGDLKSHNILVKGDFEVCKLCDFGVSLPLNSEGKINFRENPALQYVGTTLWCAPEVIAEVEVIDSKADIFSLGLIIYETIALTPPHVSKSQEDGEMEEDEKSLEITDSDIDNVSMNEFAHGTGPASLPQTLTPPHVSKSQKDGDIEEDEDSLEITDSDIENVSMNEFAYGTRPALPQAFELSDEYNIVMELFYLCTNEIPNDRPNAKIIYDSLKKNEKE